MGIVFSGTHGTGQMQTRLGLTYEHEAHLGLNMGNASAVLGLLGLLDLPDNDAQYGRCTMPEARRAILQARARFTRKASAFTREGSDDARPNRARVIRGALDEDGLALRLDKFEEFVNTMDRMGADTLVWS